MFQWLPRGYGSWQLCRVGLWHSFIYIQVLHVWIASYIHKLRTFKRIFSVLPVWNRFDSPDTPLLLCTLYNRQNLRKLNFWWDCRIKIKEWDRKKELKICIYVNFMCNVMVHMVTITRTIITHFVTVFLILLFVWVDDRERDSTLRVLFWFFDFFKANWKKDDDDELRNNLLPILPIHLIVVFSLVLWTVPVY